MKLRVAVTVAALMLLPRVGQAQGATGPLPLSRAIVQKLIPLFQAEKAGGSALATKLATASMTRATYGAYKNTLVIASLDKADPGRLARNTLLANVRKVNLEIMKQAADDGITIVGPFGPVGPDTVTPCGVLCGLR